MTPESQTDMPGPGAFRARLPSLLHATVYRLTEREPIFLRHVVEGDVAFYGLLLQATGDARLQEYLVHSSRGGLWEFHHGFGVTAADSALVLEGLVAVGASARLLSTAGDELVRRFFLEEKGAFQTVVSGRAAYWLGASSETTAQVAWLLHRIDPLRWRAQVERCTRFIRRSQHADGHWEGKWFPSAYIPTYYAVRLLAACGRDVAGERLARAGEYLRRNQLPDGSWSGLVVDTAAAVLALREIGAVDDAVERALAWLAGRVAAGGLAGEPILYYWYDDPAGKTFFSARDQSGQIAGAWATLAMRPD